VLGTIEIITSGTIANSGTRAALKIEGANTKVAMTNRGSIGEITSTYTTALGGIPPRIAFEEVGTIKDATNFSGGTVRPSVNYGWSESGWVQTTI
ncbi:MAG: hypothetical protein RR426_06950, partial [Oscillospiraceae bacterium]